MNWKDHFDYADGILYQKIRKVSNQHFVGYKPCYRECPAHYVDGYKRVKIDGRHYSHHRIIWEMHNGPIPDGMQIDHINHIRDDNRISNLRIVTKADNSRNRVIALNNTSGYHGLNYDKRYEGKVQITIGHKGKRVTVYTGYDLFEGMCRRKSAENYLEYHLNHGVNDVNT